MVDTRSSDYFRGRERQERHLAGSATDSIVAAIHLDLAERYAALTRQFGNAGPGRSR